jgi:hypothetical protein
MIKLYTNFHILELQYYITLHFVEPLVSPDTGYETCQRM